MSHFYKHQQNGAYKFLKTVRTPAQARKSGAWASVTTKLGIIANAQLDNWSRRQIFDLAKAGHEWDECNRRRYGMRTDVTGEEVTSASFGTAVHAAIEAQMIRIRDGDLSPNVSRYADYVNPFREWFLGCGYDIIEPETIVGCARRRTAGTIDVLAKDLAGQLVLMDFKTRSIPNGSKPESKVYGKDAAQLAVEARMIANKYRLDQDPRILSIVIDVADGSTGIKHWKPQQQADALEVFDAANNLYNVVNKL